MTETTEDLVKRLRRVSMDLGIPSTTTLDSKVVAQAADRIEELKAENRLLQDAVYIDDLTVTMQAHDRSMAMAAMRRALDFLNADMPTEAKTALRATLAELTGGKDD